MELKMSKQDDKLDNEIPPSPEISPKLEFENAVDAAGLWFAAAVLFGVLAADIIVYRAGDSVMRTASNDAGPAAAQSTR